MEKTPLMAAISVGNPYDLLRYTVKKMERVHSFMSYNHFVVPEKSLIKDFLQEMCIRTVWLRT